MEYYSFKGIFLSLILSNFPEFISETAAALLKGFHYLFFIDLCSVKYNYIYTTQVLSLSLFMCISSSMHLMQ